MARLVILAFIAGLTLFASPASAEENPAARLAAMNDEARAFSQSGRHAEAVNVAKSAVQFAQHTYGEASRETARQLSLLATAYEGARNITAAIVELEHAIELDKRIYGHRSMVLAAALFDLGNLHFTEREFAKARASWARSADILLKVTQGEGDLLANAYFNHALAAGHMADSERDEERLHRRSLRIREKIDSSLHGLIATSHDIIGSLVERQFRYTEAEAHFRIALTLREKISDFDREELASNAYRLADVLNRLERYDEAEPLFVRSLELYEQAGSQDARTISYAQRGLSLALYYQSRFEEAEAFGAKALAGAEKWLEADSLYLNAFREALALAKIARGRYDESTPLLRRNIDTRIKLAGENDRYLNYEYPMLINSLAGEQKFAEAEEAARFLLEFSERTIGTAFFVIPSGVDRLFSQSAEILEVQGRLDEAETHYRRILDTYDMFNRITSRSGDWDEASFLLRFAYFLDRRKKWSEAEALVERATRIAVQLRKSDDVDMAYVHDATALLLQRQGKLEEAEGVLAKSLALRRKFLRPDHPVLAGSYVEAAELAVDLDRLAAAEDYYRQALAMMSRIYGHENPKMAGLYSSLGALYLRVGRTADATGYFEKAAQIHLKEIDTTLLPANAGAANADVGKLVGNLYDFDGLIKVNYQREQAGEGSQRILEDMFAMSQWTSSSETAFALGQMSARQETGDISLSQVVRERQDLMRESQALDGKLMELVSLPYMQRQVENEREIRKQLAVVAARLRSVSDRLQQQFPHYAALSASRPLTISEVQDLLGDNEVLLSFVETSALPPLPAEMFLWAVPKRGKPLWVRVALEPDAIGAKVGTLRNLLGVGSGSRAATPISDTAGGSFDLTLAHELYQAVLGPVAPMIAGKQLIVVPSKNLSSLPFHLLVSRAPDDATTVGDAYRLAHWLIRDHAISMLPSVTSLKALRGQRQMVAGQKPYIGFGNPLLLGTDGSDRSAWQKMDCTPIGESMLAAAEPSRNDQGLSRFFRGKRADVAELRKLAPLPETVVELCAVAQSLKGSEDELFLGANATEAKLKALSLSGELASARIVHFATHGLVAGDLDFLAEPALVLTPPDKPTEEDDGLLSASEVSALKLNADWVVLSACNTAAGEGNNAEALSGLARAFFYAGTRGLLVSHWPVYSDAAVAITTGSINRVSERPEIGRAEALRQTLITLIDQGGRYAMPAYWAPFVIVGEGSWHDGKRAAFAAPNGNWIR